MGSYEYHEFRALDRPLTSEDQRAVAALSSRAEVSARHAAFTYNYSSFRGDEDELLDLYFDAMFYISSYGFTRLIFALPAASFDLERAKPYLVEPSEFADQGVEVQRRGERVVLSIGVAGLEHGWVEGEGWFEPMLPLREMLIAGDDRLLYLAWLACTIHDGIVDEESALDDERPEPPVPPGMGELDDAHRAFAECFQLDDGYLAAAARHSAPLSSEADDAALARTVDALSADEARDLLLRVARGEHLGVTRELNRRTREQHPPAPPSTLSGRTLGQLIADAVAIRDELSRRAHEERLADLEAREEELWEQAEGLIGRQNPRYAEPVKILCQLEELARERRRLDGFETRLRALVEQYAGRPALMTRLRKAKLMR